MAVDFQFPWRRLPRTRDPVFTIRPSQLIRPAVAGALVLALAPAWSSTDSSVVPARSPSAAGAAASSRRLPLQSNYYLPDTTPRADNEPRVVMKVPRARSTDADAGAETNAAPGGGLRRAVELPVKAAVGTVKRTVVDLPADLARDLLGRGNSAANFNTDYRTRNPNAPTPAVLVGRGWNGRNLAIGQEDQYRKTLPLDYMPTDLVLLPRELCFEDMILYLRREPAESLLCMIRDAARQGLTLKPFSAFRDINHQRRLYAKSGGNGSVARPGYSEHMLGTTVDITNSSRYLMRRSFEDTPEGRWLSRNAARYGWKATVVRGTGSRAHVDEPWHIRYFGPGRVPTARGTNGGWVTESGGDADDHATPRSLEFVSSSGKTAELKRAASQNR